MKKNIFALQSGKTSTIILIVGAMLLVLTIVVFIFLRINSVKNANAPDNNPGTVTEEPKPVYDLTIGDVKFTFESATDLGNSLKSPNTYQQNLTTTERFIKVVIGGQNKGKLNLTQGSWSVGNIVDSEGRNFVSINQQAYFYLPPQNLCGALLKPEFEPLGCVKLYEVSKESKGLKIKVEATVAGVSKPKEGMLDLIVK